MMKAYVYDRGWEGAEIYFSESRDIAVEYFRKKEYESYKKQIDNHNVEKSGPIPSYLNRALEKFSNKEYTDMILQEYCIEEGVTFMTDGDC